MGYKIRINMILNSQEDEEISYQIKEKFLKDYVFDMKFLEDLIDEGNVDLKPFYNYFKKTLQCEDEIFSLYNEKPRAQNNNFFIFEIEFPIQIDRKDLIIMSGKKIQEPSAELKFKKKQYFRVNLEKIVLDIYLAKYVKFRGGQKKRNIQQIEHSGSEESIQPQTYYNKKCLSESEDEFPLIYNHNNILSSLNYQEYCKKLEQRDIDKREKKLVSNLQNKQLQAELIQCNVCFDQIHTYGLINCGHIYCFNCISNWAAETNCCPLCKEKFNIIKKIEGNTQSYIDVENRVIEDNQEYFDPAHFGMLISQ